MGKTRIALYTSKKFNNKQFKIIIIAILSIFIFSISVSYALGATTVTLIYPDNNKYLDRTNTTLDFNYSYVDDTDQNMSMVCVLYIDDIAKSENISTLNGTVTTAYSNETIAEGYHTWNITCTNDTYITSAMRNFTIDTTSPTISNLISNAAYNISNNITSLNFTVTVNDTNIMNVTIGNSTTKLMSVLSGTTYNYTGTPASLGCVANGVCLITVTIIDKAGHITQTTYQLPIDTTAPSVIINSPLIQVGQSNVFTINITSSDPNFNSTIISIINLTGGTVNSTNTTNGTNIVILSVIADGIYNITAITSDLAGNTNISVIPGLIVDNIQPIINSIYLNASSDIFVSATAPNNKIVLMVNVTEIGLSGINYITANFTALNQNYTLINMTSLGGELYTANLTITNVTLFNFQPITINIFGQDNAGNTLNGVPSTIVVLYNMTTFPVVPCMVWDEDTTNMAEEMDWNDVNLILTPEINLSCMLNTNLTSQGAPNWTNEYTLLAKLNFTSVNMTSNTTYTALANLWNAIDINITLPNSFGDSRIYVNSSAFAALNTTTTLTIYHLPFTSKPSVLEDVSGGINTTGNWSQGSGEGNLTFIVNHFSGYDITDNSTPIITIHTPINGFNTTNNTPVVNITINSTGTALNSVLMIDSVDGMIGNLSNCTVSGEIYSCMISYTFNSNTAHTLTVNATDFGGAAGNTKSSSIIFTIDTIAPIINITAPTNGSYYTNLLTYITNGTGTLINTCLYQLENSTGVYNITDEDCNDTIIVGVTQGQNNITIFANDSAGNLGQSTKIIFLKDTISPTITTPVSLSDTTLTVGDTMSITACVGMDTTDGSLTVSYTNPGTTTTGTKTLICRLTDDAGNYAESQISYTVTAATTVGIASTTTTPSTTQTQSTTLGKIIANTPTNAGFSNIKLAVNTIELVLNTGEINAKITVTNLDSKPDSTTSISVQNNEVAAVYKYIEISHPSIENSHIIKAKINFKVEKSWLKNLEYSKEQIALYRYYSSEWQQLTTVIVSEDTKYVYYESESTGLSYFAISVKDEREEELDAIKKENNLTTAVITGIETVVNQTLPLNTTNVTEEVKKTNSKGWLWFLTIVIIVAAIIGAYFYNKGKGNVIIVKARTENIPVKIVSKEQYEEEHGNEIRKNKY